MPSRQLIEQFLACPYLAIVGVSRDSRQFPNMVFRKLRESGHTLYPVNSHPEVDTLEGETCYHRLADVPDPVDGVIIMVPADKAPEVIREAAARGIPRVWLHRGAGPGAVSDEAVALCRELGLEVVDGACPLMFDSPVGVIHKVHRAFVRSRFPA